MLVLCLLYVWPVSSQCDAKTGYLSFDQLPWKIVATFQGYPNHGNRHSRVNYWNPLWSWRGSNCCRLAVSSRDWSGNKAKQIHPWCWDQRLCSSRSSQSFNIEAEHLTWSKCHRETTHLSYCGHLEFTHSPAFMLSLFNLCGFSQVKN